MAGGDGSQAIVAAIAAEHGLPYVCVPAGTRNHFALDLGVNRDDVVGALDAYTKGGERIVDLAEVNGRVFVNNVSLGVYAEAVQQASYRDAKLQTLAETVPAVLGPESEGFGLSWIGPDDRRYQTSAVLLVSNDRYRLKRALGSGTRPRLDQGQLGIAVIGGHDAETNGRERVEEWTTPSLEVGANHSVAAGIDGEAVQLEAPLRFRTRPAALRVRIAPQHPGASPSANLPADAADAVRQLVRVALFGSPRERGSANVKLEIELDRVIPGPPQPGSARVDPFKNEKSPARAGLFLMRPRRLELPRTNRSTRPSTLRVYQFRHRRVGGQYSPGWASPPVQPSLRRLSPSVGRARFTNTCSMRPGGRSDQGVHAWT